MNTMDKSKVYIAIIILNLLIISFIFLIVACQTPTPPTSPIATSVSPLPSPEIIEAQALVYSEVITGEIIILWQDENLGISPMEIMASGETTATLYIDMELRLENGEVLTQTIDTGLIAPNEAGTGQFDGTMIYEWQDVPSGTHREYSRSRWELVSSDVVVPGPDDTYIPYTETIYGVIVTDGVLIEADENHFAFYRTVEVRQVYYYYLPLILSNARN